MGHTLQGLEGPGRDWSLFEISRKQREELPGSGLQGPWWCSVERPGRKRLLASTGQERW